MNTFILNHLTPICIVLGVIFLFILWGCSMNKESVKSIGEKENYGNPIKPLEKQYSSINTQPIHPANHVLQCILNDLKNHPECLKRSLGKRNLAGSRVWYYFFKNGEREYELQAYSYVINSGDEDEDNLWNVSLKQCHSNPFNNSEQQDLYRELEIAYSKKLEISKQKRAIQEANEDRAFLEKLFPKCS